MNLKITSSFLRRLLLSTVFLLAFQLGFAQNRKDNIESLKIAFLTEKLDLSPEEARTFWPVYNLYQSELDQLRDSRKKSRQALKEDLTSMTDAEAEKWIDSELSFSQAELDIQKKYHIQFKKVLPVKKIARLYRAQEEFKKELIRRLQDQKGK